MIDNDVINRKHIVTSKINIKICDMKLDILNITYNLFNYKIYLITFFYSILYNFK